MQLKMSNEANAARLSDEGVKVWMQLRRASRVDAA